HASSFDLGETDGQCVAFGETWTINPTLSEADCQALEPDPKLFAREYAAQPQTALSAAFDEEQVHNAFRKVDFGAGSFVFFEPVLLVDTSNGKRDADAVCVA